MVKIGWQPIETAPKDGTRILTFSPRAPESEKAPIRINEWRGRDWWCTNAEYWPPTHWMPLPAPPIIPAP